MTIYSLMVKTHKKTGLKYLCQTKRNPYKYRGSGVDWTNHLRIHGGQHTTEVIKKCTTKKELRYWGIHFSTLWRVVSSMDDYGNKIWANRIPESGVGSNGRQPGFHHSSETKELHRRAALGRVNSEESNQSRSVSLRGRKPWNTGVDVKSLFTPEERSKMYGRHGAANPMYGVIVEKKVCPHCGINVDKRNYARSHGDRCRFKKDETSTP